MHEALNEPVAPSRKFSTAPIAPWWHTAGLIAILIGVSFMSAHQVHGPALASRHTARYVTGIAAEWALLLLTWWGPRLRHVPLADILGFRRGLRAFAQDLGAAAVFWLAAVLVLAIVAGFLRLAHLSVPEKTLTALAPQNALEVVLWIALSLSAGFCEEFVFRGYFLRQLSSPFHRLWIGVIASSLLFGISHGYEGAAGMIAITVYGALFCALAIRLRTLRPGMIAHAWHDIFSGVALIVLRHSHLH